MNLLIVDDEELTRQGLRTALDWEALGITEISEADDGVNGLSMALKHHPDIILCDVRMPRMDGITMLERVSAHLPDTSIIFMSGYSDKEYLKAAINLKAVTYIEKPIEPEEIRQAVMRAIAQRSEKMRQQNAAQAHTNLAATRLAHALTMPYPTCKPLVDDFCAQFRQYYGGDKFKYLTTFIVRLEHISRQTLDYSDLYEQLRLYLRPMHLHIIYSEKQLFHIIYHIYGTNPPSGSTLTLIADKIHSLFSSYGDRYIAVGETVEGLRNAYHSYQSAVILLQNCFFFEAGCTMTTQKIEDYPPIDMDAFNGAVADYRDALSSHNRTKLYDALARLHDACTQVRDFMPNQVKTIYYDLFSCLYQTRRTEKLAPDFPLEHVMDLLEHCFSFSTLHAMLKAKTDAYLDDRSNARTDNAVICLIRDYITQHYSNPSLSVKDISACVNLSASYVCTYFKAETGVTLNQYITEFRMEKAKHLLADPRYKINDISAAVGYNDGNYFGKSFRKHTGLTPSEYREKVLNRNEVMHETAAPLKDQL